MNPLRAGYLGWLGWLVGVMVVPALAVDTTWTFNGDGLWTDPSKWSNGEPVDDTFDVFIDDGDTTVTVTLSGINRTIGSLSLGADDTLTIHGLVTGNFTGHARLTSASGFANDGTIALSAAGQPTTPGGLVRRRTAALVLNTGALTNNSSGVLHFQPGTFSDDLVFTGDLVNDGAVLVEDATMFNKPGGSYTNNGQVAVNSSLAITGGGTFEQAGGTLTGGLNLQEASTLNITSGELAGGLVISADSQANLLPGGVFNMETGVSGGGTFTQDGGTLNCTSGSFSGGTFEYLGGTITGVPVLSSATLSLGPAATEPVEFVLHRNNTLILQNDLLASGQKLTVQSQSSQFTSANSTSAIGFTNDGTIALKGQGLTTSFRNSASLTVTEGTLTNSATALLHFQPPGPFSGGLFFSGDLVNHGMVLVEDTTTFNKAGGSYANEGLFTIASGRTLSITSGGTFTNAAAGQLTGGGTIDAPWLINNGTIAGNGPTMPLMLNGLLTGVGALQDVRIHGTHSPGNSVAAVPLAGVYRLQGGATVLEIDIGGLAPGTEHDQLDSTGTVELAGLLDLDLLSLTPTAYVPAVGDEFTIISADGGVSGTFANSATLSSGAHGYSVDWAITYNDTSVVVRAESVIGHGVLGDLDFDGDVDGDDLDVWQNGYGFQGLTAHLQGDADLDDEVDGRDFLIWQRQFGKSVPLSTNIAVPEPSGTFLLSVALAMVCVCSRSML